MAPGKERTSSLNSHTICHNCDRQFKSKKAIENHLRSCSSNKNELTCPWCNVVFTNKGNLIQHSIIHGKKPSDLLKIHKCGVCDKKYQNAYQLRYHIRSAHFNLLARIPYCQLKKVNQVWFEKVINSNIVMEIKKTGQNRLLMRRLDANTAIKVKDFYRETVDLSNIYPTGRKDSLQIVPCPHCQKNYVKRDLKKHITEHHQNITKHYCNNCHTSFKRAYLFIKHKCGRLRKIKGVRQCNKDIKITSVQSLKTT